jgi:hypothetical protein
MSGGSSLRPGRPSCGVIAVYGGERRTRVRAARVDARNRGAGARRAPARHPLGSATQDRPDRNRSPRCDRNEHWHVTRQTGLNTSKGAPPLASPSVARRLRHASAQSSAGGAACGGSLSVENRRAPQRSPFAGSSSPRALVGCGLGPEPEYRASPEFYAAWGVGAAKTSSRSSTTCGSLRSGWP